MSNLAKRFLPLLAAVVLTGCEETPPACVPGAPCAASTDPTVESGPPLPLEYNAVPVALDPRRPQPMMDALSASRTERIPMAARPDRGGTR